MKKTKTQPRKLVLSTQTLKKLTAEQLQAVAAGLKPSSDQSGGLTVC